MQFTTDKPKQSKIRKRKRAIGIHRVQKFLLKKLVSLKSLNDKKRRVFLITCDILILFFSTYLALVLRFDQLLPIRYFQDYATGIFITITFKLIFFYSFGLYRPLLRHSGLEMLEIILKVIIISDGLIIFASTIFAPQIIPRSVQIIISIIGLILIINSRLTIRSLIWRTHDVEIISRTLRKQFGTNNNRNKSLKRILIYGAGVTGYQIAQAVGIDQNAEILGFLDDNPSLEGRQLLHHRIFNSDDLSKIIHDLDIDEILLAVPSASAKRKAEIIHHLQTYPVSIRTVPSAQELVTGKVSVTKLRDIDITDLLGRDEIPPNQNLLVANIQGKTVLVTGAGGSIGSELCRQIIQLNPKRLILLDSSEFALYSIDIELRERFPEVSISPRLGNITDRCYLEQLFSDETIETIYHAAAYKHVPMVESNPSQGVINNTFGTLLTAQTAQKFKVKTFVLISTDKAVRPTNVMGATKRAAELVLQSLSASSIDPHKTCFTMVRFGNVLGSSGSVVPRFRKQIAEGKPITLTHRDITRYFMTIPEAARLVIQAGALGKGGDVFLLDMGEPIKIYDLAVQIIKLSGLQVNRDIDIEITGLRPGEKLYEELLISGDNIKETEHPKIFGAEEHMLPWNLLEPMLQELFKSAQENDSISIRNNLKQIVKEYQYIRS